LLKKLIFIRIRGQGLGTYFPERQFYAGFLNGETTRNWLLNRDLSFFEGPGSSPHAE